jgi:hypothetical protein
LSSPIARRFAICSLAAIAVAASGDIFAFSGVVSPARLQLRATPGERVAQILEIGNEAVTPEEYLVRTADWSLNREGGVVFQDELKPGSCRPWVRIERRTGNLPPTSRRRYRFEIAVPEGTSAVECRFALVIESNKPDPLAGTGTIQFPIQGRLGVIVYVAVGKVAPILSVHKVALGMLNGRLVPVATVENKGDAHGRLEGVLEGSDAAGRSIEFNVSNFPILPGETRSIAIWPQDDASGKQPDIRYPLRLKGNLEWAGGKQSVDVTLNSP